MSWTLTNLPEPVSLKQLFSSVVPDEGVTTTNHSHCCRLSPPAPAPSSASPGVTESATSRSVTAECASLTGTRNGGRGKAGRREAGEGEVLRCPVRGGRPPSRDRLSPTVSGGTRHRLQSQSALMCLGTERGSAPCLLVPQTVTTPVGPLSSALWHKHPQETPRPQQRQGAGTKTGHPPVGAGGPERRGKVFRKRGHPGGATCSRPPRARGGDSPPLHALGAGRGVLLARGHERLRAQTPSACGLGWLEPRLRRFGTVRPSAGWPG